MPRTRGCWWVFKVKISFVNCWLASCCLILKEGCSGLPKRWKDAADNWHDSLKPPQDAPRTVTNRGEGDVMEETDNVQFFDKTAKHIGKVT